MTSKAAFLFFSFAILLFLGCTEVRLDENDNVAAKCTLLCEKKLSEGVDLSSGPCLSNALAPNWVCDVAHTPRALADNNPENQCPEYGKTASHFVEVNPNCQLIRAN